MFLETLKKHSPKMVSVKYVEKDQALTIMTEVTCLTYRKVENKLNCLGSADNQKLNG